MGLFFFLFKIIVGFCSELCGCNPEYYNTHGPDVIGTYSGRKYRREKTWDIMQSSGYATYFTKEEFEENIRVGEAEYCEQHPGIKENVDFRNKCTKLTIKVYGVIAIVAFLWLMLISLVVTVSDHKIDA